MKYIRTKDDEIFKVWNWWNNSGSIPEPDVKTIGCYVGNGKDIDIEDIIKQADTIEELCDCFVKIKRKGDCKPYILKFDYKDLPTLKEQAIKYKDSPVYGAIHIEDKGLIYVAKMNEKGELELL